MIIIKCDCSACKYYNDELCTLHRRSVDADEWCLYWDAPRGEEEDGTSGAEKQNA